MNSDDNEDISKKPTLKKKKPNKKYCS